MIYVGVDIASQKHDFFIMSDQGEVYTKNSITISNSLEGFKKFHKSIQEFCGATKDTNVRIGIESTGFYHLNIIAYLLDLDYKLMLINPLLTNMYKKSKKIHIDKNDNIDSKYICKYLQDIETVFKPYTITLYHTDALKALTRERFSLVNELRLAKINVYKLITQVFPEFLKLFSNIYKGSALEILERYNNPSKLAKAHKSTISSLIHGKCVTTASDVIEAAKNSIGIKSEHLYFLLKQAIKRIKIVQEQILEYDEQIIYYVNLVNQKILTIPGISYTTAWIILGELGDITRFKNAEQIVSFAVKYEDEEFDDGSSDKKQIKLVVDMLNNNLKIKALKFTSEEKTDERKSIIAAFKDNIIQALVAIKCLDEGMNIPAIRTAFILASSTNPKEYIQRRGRVLRKYPGKKYADIYDFITLPFPLEDAPHVSYEKMKYVNGLVKRELTRFLDFANLAMNTSECNSIFDNIKSTYDLDIINIDEEVDLYE